MALSLNEVDGSIGGLGTVGTLPVHVTGGRLADGQVTLALLPADASTQTDNIAANGQLSQGSLRLRLGANRDVELRSGAESQWSSRFLVEAPPYRIALDLDAKVWSSNVPLLGGSSGSILMGAPFDALVRFALMDSSGNASGEITVSGETFPNAATLRPPSLVFDPQFNSVELHGMLVPDSGSPALPAPTPAGSPPAVGGLWAGPNFKLAVTQAGNLLSAAGVYRGVLVRGTGRASEGLFLNTALGETGVDGVIIVRRPDGQFTVTDSARGTTETVAGKLWDDNLQTTGDTYSISASPPEQTFLMDVTGTTPSGFTGTWGLDYGQGKYQPDGTIVAFDQGDTSTVILHFGANTSAVIAQYTFPRFRTGVPGSVPLTAGEYLGERSSGSARLVTP